MGNTIYICSQKLIVNLIRKPTCWELSFFDLSNFQRNRHLFSHLPSNQPVYIKKDRYFDKECACVYHGNKKYTYVRKTNAVCIDKI